MFTRSKINDKIVYILRMRIELYKSLKLAPTEVKLMQENKLKGVI